ncbi:blastula protease 10-like, partial [Hyalella azteca]|uniref:Blastula protease 10-like n=1 Tax=Hyalella azteca TaxID=294128 RepID=A0A8B7N498_HYAAZ
TNLKTCKLDKDPCLNQGYMGPACKCLCPPGTKGKNCEVLKMSYEDAMLKLFWPNSTKITKPNTVVQTPGYPDAVNSELVMDIVLQAGKCERVVLTFEGFSVMERSAQGLCQSDKLAIKSKVDDASPRTFCGKEILPGQVFKSDQSLLILSYHGFNYAGVWGNNGGTTGWKALFTKERIPGCTG